jgi:integrase
MALTDPKIRQAKAKEKPYKLGDEKGLFLLVNPAGSKLWRLKYRFAGKEKLLTLGSYPEVSLKEAREKRDQARSQMANGLDPGQLRQLEKQQKLYDSTNSFSAIANEWLTKQMAVWGAATATKRRALLNNDLIPYLGKHPIAELETFNLLAVLRRIEERGAIETAHNARQLLNQIFRYAKQTGLIKENPASDLVGAIAPKKTMHRPAITDPAGFGQLLLKIDRYKGTHIVRVLLALAPLLFQRPGELLAMKWADVDFENGEWRYTVGKTKTPHIVPLSRQAKALLLDIKPLTGSGIFVFPSQRRSGKHASENTINKALRNMGYDTETQHCAHGFRASARTMLEECLDVRVELIEHQLAHAVKDPLGRAYNRTKHIDKRHEMMQAWADYLDSLRLVAREGNVVVMTHSRKVWQK